MMPRTLFLLLILLILLPASLSAQETLRVGAKHFNEGYILSEMIAQVLEDGGYTVDRRFNLGGTIVSFEALRNGAIDVYPEYTGTIEKEILKEKQRLTRDQLARRIQEAYALEISEPYGFSNSYALLIRPELQRELSIQSISDLVRHPDLRVGMSYEFLERYDGWNNLSTFYALPQTATALEHGLAYQAIRNNEIDVTDAYTTDGEISKYGLVLLDDDRQFFPSYQAVSLYATQFPEKARQLLHKLTHTLSEKDMQRLNAQALFEKMTHFEIAQAFLIQKGIIRPAAKVPPSMIRQVMTKTWQHIQLSFLALGASLLLALPLGLLVYRHQRISRVVLYTSSILQTIPSIALLALLIPLAGIGTLTAVMALFLYALLPILRNTIIGLSTIDPVLRKVAVAIGLTPWNSLRYVELPLAAPMIIAGIRTAAVINVGTATLAAFIGAGGLGEFIVTGLALNNTTMILMGAIPAAALAIATELTFEAIEKVIIPSHLRQATGT